MDSGVGPGVGGLFENVSNALICCSVDCSVDCAWVSVFSIFVYSNLEKVGLF